MVVVGQTRDISIVIYLRLSLCRIQPRSVMKKNVRFLDRLQKKKKKSINQNLLEDPLEENGKKKRAIWGSPSKKTGSLGASGREGDPDRPEWLDNEGKQVTFRSDVNG